MVYESDFYTTRRPYSRPTVTSYSVTRRAVPWHLVPTVPRPSQVPPCYTAYGCKGFPDDEDDYLGYPYMRKMQPYHKNIPYIGHKRLVIVQPSAHGWRVKQSSLLGEIDRIYHKVRPSLAYQPKEDYLNSRSIMSFDDETRSIRAKSAEILKKIHTPVPRAQRPMPLPGEVIDEVLRLRQELANVATRLILYPTCLDYDRLYYSHSELPITERIISDNYIDRLLTSARPSAYPLPAITLYEEPRTYNRLGKSHLACVTYAAGKPMLRRRNLASVENYIRDDINLLSHYNRFRQAAERAPHVPETEYGSIPHMPPTKSPVTGSWKSNAPRRTYDKVVARTISDDDATQERKKKRREQLEEEAMKEAEQEKRRNEELKRQEELAEQAAAERQAELERKAQQEEEERILREEEERMEALRKEEEERKAKEEEEARLAKEEEEKKAKAAEAKRKAKEEAARKAEEERKAREEEERRIKEEEERKAREEEERRLKEEEEQRQREEEERLAKEEEERKIKEEEERKAEEERLAKEEEEKQKPEPAEDEEQEEEKEEEEKPEETEAEAEEPAEKPQPEEETKEPEAEEPAEEPVVEEPLSPEEAPAKTGGEEEEEEPEEEEDE